MDVPLAGHHRVLLCAADVAATEPSLVMAARFAPSVPVRDTASFQREPRRALFDSSAAARVLGWEPHYKWSTGGAQEGSQRQPSLFSQVIASPLPATPETLWSESRQYSPGL
jgi:hypothetical protein